MDRNPAISRLLLGSPGDAEPWKTVGPAYLLPVIMQREYDVILVKDRGTTPKQVR